MKKPTEAQDSTEDTELSGGDETYQVPESKDIYEALYHSRARMGPLLRNATNPHFKNRYADLAAVVQVIAEAFHEAGILILQIPYWDPETAAFYLRTTLRHIGSATEVTTNMKVVVKDPDNPQSIGASLTYMRRYALTTMTGLAPEDDDGNKATAPANRQRAQVESETLRKTREAPKTDQEAAATQNTRPKDMAKLYAAAEKAGYDENRLVNTIQRIYPIANLTELTPSQITKLSAAFVSPAEKLELFSEYLAAVSGGATAKPLEHQLLDGLLQEAIKTREVTHHAGADEVAAQRRKATAEAKKARAEAEDNTNDVPIEEEAPEGFSEDEDLPPELQSGPQESVDDPEDSEPKSDQPVQWTWGTLWPFFRAKGIKDKNALAEIVGDIDLGKATPQQAYEAYVKATS